MSGPRLRTVVADTSALVSLAVPRADAAIGTDVPDPFQYLLTSCDVVVPPEVVAELRDITQYQDIHAAAASNVPRGPWPLHGRRSICARRHPGRATDVRPR